MATPSMARRLHPAWVVLAVTFVALLASTGVRATPSVLIVPLEEEFGWIGAGHQIGAALAAFAAGWIRTVQGDYRLAFWGSGALCLLAAALALQVGRRASTRRGYGSLAPAATPAAVPIAGLE